jgi:hypothetical protein
VQDAAGTVRLACPLRDFLNPSLDFPIMVDVLI